MGSTTPPPTHILLILAGGTICMQSSPNGYIPTRGLLSKCLAGHEAFDDGTQPTPADVIDEKGVQRPGDASFILPPAYTTSGAKDDTKDGEGKPAVHYTAFEFDQLIDSSSADSYYWNFLASVVARNYEAYDGFVILHGTDTLAFAASALSFALSPLRKPVILTGSQVSIFDDPSDAWDNILGSLTLAGEKQINEVGVFFHGNLFRGNRSVKIHASEYAAFGSPNLDPLVAFDGITSVGESRMVAHALHSAAQTTPEPLAPLVTMDSAQVCVLRIYPGLQPLMLSAILSTPGLRGLIIETFGAGNMPSGPSNALLKVLEEAIARGIIVVNVSQCLNGTVSPIYAPARALERLGVVYGHDMTTEAAYTKLLYLLALRPELDVEEVKAQMSTDLRGELTHAKAAIDRTQEKDGGAEPQRARRRRSSLVVTGLAWRSYQPRVIGRSVSRER